MVSHPTVVALSPRLGAVLPAAALGALRSGAAVYADHDVDPALAERFGAASVGDRASGVLLTADPTTGAAAAWLAAGAELVRTEEPPGATLLDAVAVMDRLRSPGGCPWDAEQTHASLLPYLIEETYELYEALEHDDRAAVAEELGDVLLQVLFHARVAAEDPAGFDIDAVAEALVAKLVGRHPHVFAGTEQVRTSADQQHRWEELKQAEKRRESCVDGVALGQPAVALAAKLASRAARAGVPVELMRPADGLGGDLFALAAAGKLAGDDPESELRAAALAFAEDVRAAERSARAAGLDLGSLSVRQWQVHWPAPCPAADA